MKANNWLSGIQWLFFIFTNIVVIPITVGEAFELPQESIVSLLQLSFIVTGIACMLQALVGHGRAVMEGQSGLWWGVILTLVTTASAQGMPLDVLGGSISVGVIISGIITVIIGLSGLGTYLAKLFNSAVMGVFMFLLGAQLVGIFMKGMLGIPFGNAAESGSIQLPIALLSIIIVTIVIFINIKAKLSIRRYSLLIGIIAGWILYIILFDSETSAAGIAGLQVSVTLFPFGNPKVDIGIIITIVLTGLLNIANTFGALKGTNNIYRNETTNIQYRASFTITGAVSAISGFLGLVPYSPYVSSIGFLKQTGDIRRLPFVLGGFLFVLMGLIPPVGGFFSTLPLSVGSAVLFVSYVLLFHSSLDFFKQVKFNTVNVYRSAVPLFVGIIIMTMPASYFTTLPSIIRPLVSNGLLMGILLAIVLESIVDWDRYGE
ncbi:uracil/xanthine transporter [Oceanobacillus zhaokaii]|uniref:Uracil/xanthine transporter n=2 Tax=Oceanobacillus zhaokaii TaxID=2052660 RepID=A0A345PMG4_9BACI|nr:uracil/xanthine transporter [Oceanobacillus zhaokaii]